MKTILLHATAGHGHKKAAEALLEELKRRDETVEIVDVLPLTSFFCRHTYSQTYFFLVTYCPWAWDFFYRLTDVLLAWKFFVGIRAAFNHLQAGGVEKYLIKENPAYIVSTHFMGAEIASRLKREGKITSRICTVITDYLVHRLWVNQGTDLYFGMLDDTVHALAARGAEAGKVIATGIPVSYKFSEAVDKAALLKDLNLEPGRCTLLISSGSFGTGPIQEVLNRLESFKEQVQTIVVCGLNESLKQQLIKQPPTFPAAILGYVNNMHALMAVSDLLLSRSSGITTTESLVRRLPLVVISSIPGQEQYNADLLKERQAAFILEGSSDAQRLESFSDIIKQFIHDPQMSSTVKANIEGLRKPMAARDIVNAVLELQ